MDDTEDQTSVVDQLVERLDEPVDDTTLLGLLDGAAMALIEADLIHRLVPHARRLRAIDFADHPWAGLLGGVAICAIDRPRGRTELRRSREAFERIGDRLGNGYACFLEGLEDTGEGQIATAADWWRRSRELLDGEGPVEGMALAHLALGAYADGDLRLAHLMAHESLTTARRRQDDRVIAIACMYLGFVHFHTGEFAAADAALAEGVAGLERIVDPANRYELPMLLAGQGSVASLRGAADVAERRWNEAIGAATRDGNRWYESITRVMRSDFTSTDNPVRAIEDARCALDYFSWAGEEWWVHWARTALISAHRSSGALATAAELAQRLLAAPLTPLERGRALLSYGETLLALEDPLSVSVLEEAVHRLDNAGANYWAARAELLLAVVEPNRTAELTTSIGARAGDGLHDPAWVALLDPATALATNRPSSITTRPTKPPPSTKLIVLDLVSHGFTSRQAAAALLISPSTVDTHIRAVMKASGSRTRAQAAADQREPRPSNADAAPTLGRDELATLELLAAGRTIAQVADELHYSRRTVERRLAALRERIGAATNQALLSSARELRIV